MAATVGSRIPEYSGVTYTGLKSAPSQIRFTLDSDAESGYPNLYSATWIGFFVPAQTPGSVVFRLNAEINEALKGADVPQKLQSIGFDVITTTPAERRSTATSPYPSTNARRPSAPGPMARPAAPSRAGATDAETTRPRGVTRPAPDPSTIPIPPPR